MSLTYQKQPTKTSCGPTCVAMLVGKPAREIIALLPRIRKEPTRLHSTNYAEMLRLFNRYGYTLSRRYKGWPTRLALLRIECPTRRNWHWALFDGTRIYDPSWEHRKTFDEYPNRTFSYYEIEAR